MKKIIYIFILVFIFASITLYFVFNQKDNNIRYYTKEEVKKFVYEYLKIDTEKEIELNRNNLDKEKDKNGDTYGDYSQHRVKETAKAKINVTEIKINELLTNKSNNKVTLEIELLVSFVPIVKVSDKAKVKINEEIDLSLLKLK